MLNEVKCRNAAKKIILLCVLCAFVGNIVAQKPTKQPTKAKIDKMMDDAMKGMSKEDAAMMKEMMKQQTGKPAAQQPVNLDDVLKDNKQLVPAKNTAKINALKKKYTAAEVTSTVNSMYTKLLAKGDAAQIAMAKKAMLVAKTCTALMDAANTAMLQGQPHTTLLLSLKAVQTCANNLVAQNNLAALLTQYGYPEQAIPFLQKINEEDKGNSTVLNNLAYAWLGLGETETAYQNAYKSVMSNPQHPQSRLLCGIILEKEGKTSAAKQQIEIARKFNTSKLSEQVAKNSGDNNPIVKMSWAEIKKRVSVYEYFPKGWRKTYFPAQNTLAYQEQFYSDFGADQKMRGAFEKKVSDIIKSKEKVNDLEIQKPGEMMKKMMATDPKVLEFTINANKVMASIMYAFAEERNTVWEKKLREFVDDKSKRWSTKIEGLSPKMTCAQTKPIIDAHHQKNMNEYNTALLAFLSDLEEEFRFFYNAMATWTLLQSTPATKEGMEISFLNLVKDFGSNEDDFALWWKHYGASPVDCSQRNTAPPKAPEPQLTQPEIPNFNCLVIFKIPSGFGSLDFSNKGFSAADNEYGITASGTNKSPNMSTSLGTSGSRVSEPGLKKDPYTNTSSGSTEPVLGTPDDEEPYPLTKPSAKKNDDDDKDEPLPKPSAVNSSWNDDELTPLISDKDKELRDARNTARELLDNAMSTSCDPNAAKKKKAEMLEHNLIEISKRNRVLNTREYVKQELQNTYEEINSIYDEKEREAKIAEYDRINKKYCPDFWEHYALNMDDLQRHRELGIQQSKERRRMRRKEADEKYIRILTYLNALTPEKRAQNLKDREKVEREWMGNDYERFKFDYDKLNKEYGLKEKELSNVSTNNGLTPTQNNGFNLPGKIAGFVQGLFN